MANSPRRTTSHQTRPIRYEIEPWVARIVFPASYRVDKQSIYSTFLTVADGAGRLRLRRIP